MGGHEVGQDPQPRPRQHQLHLGADRRAHQARSQIGQDLIQIAQLWRIDQVIDIADQLMIAQRFEAGGQSPFGQMGTGGIEPQLIVGQLFDHKPRRSGRAQGH